MFPILFKMIIGVWRPLVPSKPLSLPFTTSSGLHYKTKGSEDTFTLAGSFEASAVHKQLLQTFSCWLIQIADLFESN